MAPSSGVVVLFHSDRVNSIINRFRYVAFPMAEVAIPQNLFADILRMIAELRPPPNPAPT